VGAHARRARATTGTIDRRSTPVWAPGSSPSRSIC
jgi:hypothetical protein